MAGITDRPYRQLCRELGAGLAVSEMVASNSSLWASRKSLKRLDFSGESGPISVQIVGADPATMADAAKINADRGAQIIDINMGCPAKKVCRVAAGSALMRDEGLVARILETVVDAVAYGAFERADFAAGEGAPAPDVSEGESLSRDNMHRDSNDNATDFRAGEPTPGR